MLWREDIEKENIKEEGAYGVGMVDLAGLLRKADEWEEEWWDTGAKRRRRKFLIQPSLVQKMDRAELFDRMLLFSQVYEQRSVQQRHSIDSDGRLRSANGFNWIVSIVCQVYAVLGTRSRMDSIFPTL